MPSSSAPSSPTELRKLNPTLPIVIASGYGGAGFEARALSGA
jgi:hypothetical protein